MQLVEKRNKFFLHSDTFLSYNGWRYGGLLKRSKRSHSKCDRPLIPARGFESHVLRWIRKLSARCGRQFFLMPRQGMTHLSLVPVMG